MANVFISHAAVDKALADLIGEALGQGTPALSTFIASRAGDIPAEAEWLPSIQAELLQADSYMALLTPNSVSRPWVAFEMGVAWFNNRKLVLVRIEDLASNDIPFPLGTRQIYRLDRANDLTVIFHSLGTSIRNGISLRDGRFVQDASELAEMIRNLPKPSFAGFGEPAWEGVTHGGQYYAWAGPLIGLDDREPTVRPHGLVEALESRGLKAGFGNPSTLSHKIATGRCQVFATDRKSWRRPIVNDSGQLLLVR